MTTPSATTSPNLTKKVVVAWADDLPFAPSHFLGTFHPAYDENADENGKALGFDDWVGAFTDKNMRKSYSARAERPQINPWILKEWGSSYGTWERNPYYWRVDTQGNQLPYTLTLLWLPQSSRAAIQRCSS